MIAYPVTIHCTADAEKPSSRSIDARATFTMLKSRTTMNAAVRIRARPSPRCADEPDGPGAQVGPGALAGPVAAVTAPAPARRSG